MGTPASAEIIAALGPTVRVLDASNNQPGTIDFGAVRAAGIAGVILKASEGTAFVDLTFAPRAQAAHAAGLEIGAYHYFRPDQSPGAQAALFVGRCKAAGVPIAFRTADCELGPIPVEGVAESFIVAALVTLLYSGSWFAGHYLSAPIPGVLWWLAAYGSVEPTPPWGTRAGWQFTQTASVPGVTGLVDESYFDPAAWAQLTGGDMPLTEQDLTAITTIVSEQIANARPAIVAATVAAVLNNEEQIWNNQINPGLQALGGRLAAIEAKLGVT